MLADEPGGSENWTFSVIPSDEFREVFVEAWRLQRDYFYDRNMHGVDWTAMRDKYGELVDRVTRPRRAERPDRADGERAVGAAHLRRRRRLRDAAPDQVQSAVARRDAGARRSRRAATVVRHVYRVRSGPCRTELSPLARPGVEVERGRRDLLAINGIATAVGRRSRRAAAQPGGQAGAAARRGRRARPSRATWW